MGDSSLSLQDALTATPWRRLVGIAAQLGLPVHRGERKAIVIERLRQELSQAAVLAALIAQLDGEAQAALAALANADGHLPVVTVHHRFGPVRTESTAAKSAVSATEQLWWYGLIYLAPPRRRPGVIQAYCLPQELLAPIRAALPATSAAGALQLWSRPGRPADLLWHCGLWVATIAGAAVQPLHGRWLPPTWLGTVAARLGVDQDVDYMPSRSERQQPYLAFLHYLTEVAELVQGERLLTVTHKGWQWLATEPHLRRLLLWQSWQQATREQAVPYRFPWEPCSSRAKALVCQVLARLPLGEFVPLRQITEALRLQDPWQVLPAAPLATMEQADVIDPLAALCCGPLFWQGLLDIATAPTSLEPDNATASVLWLRLTPLGNALLTGNQTALPAPMEPKPCVIRRGEPDQIVVPVQAAPVHLAQLSRFCRWEPHPSPQWEQCLVLTPETVANAAAHGVPMATLVHALEAALGRRLSRRERQRWHGWHGQGEQVRLRALWILESKDPATMTALRQRRVVKRRLGESLSPTRSVVAPHDGPALVQALRTLHHYVVLPTVEPAAEDAGKTRGVSATAPDLLWMLLCLYRGLGELAALPLTVDFTSEQQVRQQLSPTRLLAAEALAQAILTQLVDAQAGYLRIPHWQLPISAADHRPVLEAALAAGQEIEISYWSSSSGGTTRRLTPYFIEDQRGVAYLHAYCHLRGQERVFRIDRIATICPLEPTTNT